MTPLAALRDAVSGAASELRSDDGQAGRPTLERPPKAQFGDYSTNAAMLLAPVLEEPPRAIAERLGAALGRRLGAGLERVDVAGPGFLNLFLSDAWYVGALADVLAAGQSFGGGGAQRPERVQVEFVSANPTGPLTAAGGRHAAFGDALARVLAFHGHEVQREYYVNDFGTQVRKLGESIRARARDEPVPEGGYEGDYVRELAMAIPHAADSDAGELAYRGVELMVERIRASLEAFRVGFDSWSSERELHEGAPSAVERALEELDAHGQLYWSSGALWLRTTAFGDDKDRVLRRSTGEPTYFLSDIAYHQDKRARGFERVIDVWGADHHGYVGRLRAAWEALGGEPEALELVIMQFVHLVEGGARASMSKRRGDFVTLDDLVGEIGVDATRFFLLQRSHDTELVLDLDLAREESAENPVYYLQYAHARIASVLAKAGEPAVAAALDGVGALEPELDPAERALVKKLVAFPDEVADAAERRAPHRIAAYALELAQDFTVFYRDCRVVGADGRDREPFRLALCVASRQGISRVLDLLGVSAPESM